MPDLPPEVDFAWVSCSATDDRDGDGFARALELEWDADISGGGDSAWVSAKVYGLDGGRIFMLGEGPTYLLRGSRPDTVSLHLDVLPENQPPATWDLAIQLSFGNEVVFATYSDFPQLEHVAIEGAMQDQSSGRIGLPRPNPTTTIVSIPVQAPSEGDWAGFCVRDVNGRLLRNDGDIWLEFGEHEFLWNGYDAHGHAAPSGIYYISVRMGSVVTHQRCLLIRSPR